MHHTSRHSLEGKNQVHQGILPGNQGIVDDRPEGRQPQGSTILLDTVVDQDATAENDANSLSQSIVPGATSRDVYQGLGVPIQGMSSKELRHDGQLRHKRLREGVEQFGEGVAGESGRGDSTRRVDGTNERRWVAGKTEFREES